MNDGNLQLDKIDRSLIELGQLCKLSNTNINIKLDLLTNLSSESRIKNTYWKSGTGYGSGNSSVTWNINDYLNKQEELNENICNLLNSMVIEATISKNYPKIINNGIFQTFLKTQLNGLTILEFEKKQKLFSSIMEILDFCMNHDSDNIIKEIINNTLADFTIDVDMILNSETDILEQYKSIKDLLIEYKNLYEMCKIEKKEQLVEDSIPFPSNFSELSEQYKSIVKEHQFKNARN